MPVTASLYVLWAKSQAKAVVVRADVQQLYFAEAYSFFLTAEHSGSTETIVA